MDLGWGNHPRLARRLLWVTGQIFRSRGGNLLARPVLVLSREEFSKCSQKCRSEECLVAGVLSPWLSCWS